MRRKSHAPSAQGSTIGRGVDQKIQGPASRVLNVTVRVNPKRAVEQRRVRDDRMIFAAFAARVDAEPDEIREQIARESAAEPGVIEEFGARGNDQRIGARGNPLLEQILGRQSLERFDSRHPVRLALAFRPSPVLVEHDVAEDHVRDSVGRERFERA